MSNSMPITDNIEDALPKHPYNLKYTYDVDIESMHAQICVQLTRC